MSRPTHVMVQGWVDISDSGRVLQTWPMPIEEFAKLFVAEEPLPQYGPVVKRVPIVAVSPESNEP